MEKRQKGCEVLLAAKIRRQDDENAALRERETIRESTTEGEDEPANVPAARSLTPPAIRPLGLPNRRRRMPKRFRDNLPPAPVLAPAPAPHNEPVAADGPLEPTIPPGKTEYFTTEPDSYGVFCSYPYSFLTFDPDNLTSLLHVSV
ncbi:hypothetical protein EV424DRAFT_1352485 [Suillus variegatus]|nr:hypothetical protein EV424DRAFT_1352485 [Suillus variegatus]